MSDVDRNELVAADLVTGYRSAHSKVVTRASFRIEPSTIVALIGPNGSGKTTLLRTLIGLLAPISGSVTIGGTAPSAYRRGPGIGYLPEGLNLPPAWSGRGLLALSRLINGRSGPSDLSQALEIAGVDFDISLPVQEMSKGMRQRIALALALLPLPGLLLLDEPEAGLDPAQRLLLRGRIQRFARSGRIVIVATHDLTGMCTIADRIYLMYEQAMQLLAPAEVLDAEQLIRRFGLGGPT